MMRQLDFSYDLQLDFSRPVHRHAFQLRCIPPERNGQQIKNLTVSLSPEANCSQSVDGFGNALIFGLAEGIHTQFYLTVSGMALLEAPYLPDTALNAARFKPQTAMTLPGKAIQMLYRQTPFSTDVMTRSLALMHTVRAEIAYVPASTTIATTAEQAAAQGCGVCQDHTQILLSLLRMDGIPCRYAAGLLLGEGRTHAWAEAWIDGQWIGLDATNGTMVRDTHILIAIGRDHTDCALNRGVMLGSGEQRQTVHVSVREKTIDP